MKKQCYYLLILILNISFLHAAEVLPETGVEEQENQIEDVIADDNLITSESLTKDTAISESEPFSTQTNTSNIIDSAKDLELPASRIDLPRKNTFLAVGLSTLLPGLGHAYLDDYNTAGSIFGSSIIGFGSLFNRNTAVSGTYLLEVSYSYGIYAAYRDSRLYNNDSGYSYKMPTDSFKELSFAPFNFKVLKKPEVWGGLLGAFVAAGGIVYLQDKLESKPQCAVTSSDIKPLTAFPVGFSEEVFFRGYLQSALSEIASPVGGIIISSLAFGAAHIPNAKDFSREDRKNYYKYSLPFITGFGAYFGWMTYKNQSLQESVALHSWYDFALFALHSAATNSAMIGRPNFAFSFRF